MDVTVRNLLRWLLPAGIAAGAVSAALFLDRVSGDWKRADTALHASVETIGGLSAMAMALVLLVRRSGGGTGSTSHFLLAFGFLGMGLVEIFHAMVSPGDAFVWFRVLASLVGGLGFALAWWPEAWRLPVGDKASVRFGVGTIAVFGVLSWLLSGQVAMLHDGKFTPLAIALKKLASVLFALGAARYFLIYARARKPEDYLFACLALLFAVAESVFSYSSLWDGPWWFWHFLRLLAYALVLGYIGRDYLQTVANLGASLAETRTAETALRLSESQLRQSLDERETLARNLHDSIIQSIYAIGLRLSETRRLIATDAQQAVQTIGVVINEINAVIREVRLYISGVEVNIGSGKELEAGMAALVHTMGSDEVMRFYLQLDSAASERLTPLQATHLLYIAKEAMSNSLRHSQARNGSVSLKLGDGVVQMKVEDDGQGFDTAAEDTDGRGLKNIRARAGLLGASCEMISAPGHGTQVTIKVPVEASDAAH